MLILRISGFHGFRFLKLRGGVGLVVSMRKLRSVQILTRSRFELLELVTLATSS